MIVHAASDLHGTRPVLPGGDLLIFAGDITCYGTDSEVMDFDEWCGSLPYEEVVVIAGNHDRALEHGIIPFENAHYLCDSQVDVCGLKIWGSPYTPEYGLWSFMEKRDTIKRHWDLIPDNTDILVTHGPPHKILDDVDGRFCGDMHLLDAVMRVKPKAHVFGHIHEHGLKCVRIGDTAFYNAAVLNGNYCFRGDYIKINIMH